MIRATIVSASSDSSRTRTNSPSPRFPAPDTTSSSKPRRTNSSRAFGVTLQYFEAEGAHYYAYDERVRLPRELRAVTENVLGLDSIPTHRTARRAARRDAHADIATLERQYCFPAVDARGRRIALLEFGGGFSPKTSPRTRITSALPSRA